MHTFTFTGASSILTGTYFPPIHLDEKENYEIALLSFESFNNIPNVDAENNVFQIQNFPAIKLPHGNYELDNIAEWLKLHITDNENEYKNVTVKLKANPNTLKSLIKCSHPIDFTVKNSIHELLGFNARVVEAKKYTESDHPVNIFRVNVIQIDCSIANGAYHNNEMTHTLHEFFPKVPPGVKIIEVPHNLIYLPVNTKIIDYIKIDIRDQEGRYVNFNSEVITLRLHLRKVKHGD